MSSTTVRQRACRLLNESWIGVVLALSLGLLATAVLVENLADGASLRSQAWYGGFLIAYGVGLARLFRNVRDQE